MRRVKFAVNHYYHIYNRGVDKREIFLDDQDRRQFLKYMRRFLIGPQGGLASSSSGEAKPLVEFHTYSLLPNHYHFQLRQISESGITIFMHRLGTTYTMFFNKKYERTGRLFEGPFKAVLIENDSYFFHLSRYIHLNPLDLLIPNWREEGVGDWKGAEEFLENYPWSSYRDFVGKRKGSFVKTRFILDYFGGVRRYKNFIRNWTGAVDFEKLEVISLEA